MISETKDYPIGYTPSQNLMEKSRQDSLQIYILFWSNSFRKKLTGTNGVFKFDQINFWPNKPSYLN